MQSNHEHPLKFTTWLLDRIGRSAIDSGRGVLRRFLAVIAVLVPVIIASPTAQAGSSWTFATDTYRWYGLAAAPFDRLAPGLRLRCPASGVNPAAYPGGGSNISALSTIGGSFTLLVSERINLVAAGNGNKTGIAVAIDGRAMGASEFFYLAPEKAFGAIIPIGHPLIEAMKNGRVLTLRDRISGEQIVVSLVEARAAIDRLAAFCAAPLQAPAQNTATGTDPAATAVHDPNIPPKWRAGEGRVLASGGTWIPSGIVPNSKEEIREFSDLALLMALRENIGALGEILSGETGAVQALALFPPEQREKILRQELKALPDNFEGYLNQGVQSFVLTSLLLRELTPFQYNKLASGIRARLPGHIARTAPRMPMQLRLYCQVALGRYDFDIEAFPFGGPNRPNYDQAACGKISIRPGLSGTGFYNLIANLPEFPESLAMAPDAAESLLARLGGNSSALVYIDSELRADWKLNQRGRKELAFTLSSPGPYNIVTPEALDTVLLSFVAAPPRTQTEVLAARLSGDESWNISDPDSLAQLVRLAGDATTLPADWAALDRAGGKPIGKLEFPLWTPNFEAGPQDTGNRTTLLFREYVPGRSNSFRSLPMALGIPREHLAVLNAIGGDNSFSAMYAVLPDKIENYTITAPADKYGRGKLAARVSMEIKAVTKFALPNGEAPILVLSVEPFEASFTETGKNPVVIERFDIRRDAALPAYDILDVPPRYNLVRALGAAYGLDVKTLMENSMRHPKGLSVFDTQKRVEAVFTASETVASDGAPDYWIVGSIRLNDYDFSSGTFPYDINGFGLALPEMGRDPELANDVISTSFIDRKFFAVAIDPAEAEEFSKRLNLPGDLPFRVLVRPRQASFSDYRRMNIKGVAVYGEILERNSVLTINDPDRVVYRFGTRPNGTAPLRSDTKPSITREEAVAFLKAAVDENESTVMIRHSKGKEVSVVLTDGIGIGYYERTVRDEALDLPEGYEDGFAADIAEKFRNDPNAALLLNIDWLLREPNPSVQVDAIQELLISLVQEIDLVIEKFPPKPQAIISTGQAKIEVLLAGDSRFVVIHRREYNGPIMSAYTAQSDRNFYGAGLGEIGPSYYNRAIIEDLGYVIKYDLPEQSSRIELREIPNKLRTESGAVVVLSPESLKKIFNRISDLDLVGRRFPLEDLEIGIPKDHKKTAEQFSVLGVPGGIERQTVVSLLTAEFGQSVIEDPKADAVYAGGDLCVGNVVPRAGKPEEVGTRCARATFDDGMIKSISVRQVIDGNVEQAVLKALIERFGRNPFMKEVRYLEAGGKRFSQGWGDIIPARREALGRADGKLPPTVVEAVVWIQNGVTTVFVQLDDLPTLEEERAARTPKIKF